MGIPTGFSVCMGWVWALKFNPHGSPGKYSNHIKFLCFVECKRLNGLSIADSLFFVLYLLGFGLSRVQKCICAASYGENVDYTSLEKFLLFGSGILQ